MAKIYGKVNSSKDHGSFSAMSMAHSTHASLPVRVKVAKVVKAAPKLVLPKMKPAGSNAQTRAYGKAMSSAHKKTKVFGMPGR